MSPKKRVKKVDYSPPEPVSITEPQVFDDLIAIYSVFRDQVYRPQSVLHPSCAYDSSPSRVFDNVTYVDLDQKAMELFRRFGLKAHGQDIRNYKPVEEHDLLILLNPAIPTEWASRHLKGGGYILTNDYHGNASWMHQHPNKFELFGTIDFVEQDRRRGDNRVAVSRNLEGLFEPVQDGEELRRLRTHEYEFIAQSYPHILKQMGKKPGRTFEETYKKFQRMMHESEELPSKRDADRYIFVKK